MYQIRIHGRGGQGVVTAAELIAIAAFEDGWHSQAFPSFGVERTGAPVESFARIDDKPIRLREQVYNPDILIILDASLIGTVDMTSDCDDNTQVILNTSKAEKKGQLPLQTQKISAIDASGIALDVLGKNVANTTILGAFAKATGLISLKGLEKAIKQKFEEKGKEIVDKNIEAVKKANK
jgi:pyruvate ferredoxin oxidoreductase gamma subunit